MHYSIVFATLVTSVSAHGIIRNIVGANNVSMPGLGISDGTPRNCVVNACGAQADTSIIRDADIAKGKSPLGFSQGNGEIDAEKVVAAFMGKGNNVPTNSGTSGATGVEDDIPADVKGQRVKRYEEHMNQMRDMFSTIANLHGIGVLGLGGKPSEYPTETMIQDTAGKGAEEGMPTSNDNGEVNLIYRQINQDGAGPLTASIDSTSGGKDGAAFQTAEMPVNMPGVGISGLSVATNTDFPVTVRMPEGMTCEGEIAGVKNVCVVRVRNQALAGPFGGSAAFVQSRESRKRAVAYRLRKRFDISRKAEE